GWRRERAALTDRGFTTATGERRSAMKIRLTRFTLLALLALIGFGVGDHAIALDDPNRITLPTAASIVGAAPFFSDVRVFNTSYDSTISLEATYRCFIGACPAVDRGLQIV